MGLGDQLWLALEGVFGTPADPETRRERVAEMTAAYRVEGAREVGAEEVLAAMASGRGPVLVDARSEEERAVSTLPGALPADAIEADPGAWAGKELVVFCTIGYRSGRWAVAHPDLDVRNLDGGVLAWSHAGGGFVDASGSPTRTVHVWGRSWDLLPDGLVAVW